MTARIRSIAVAALAAAASAPALAQEVVTRTDDTGARASACVDAAKRPVKDRGGMDLPQWVALGPYGGDIQDVASSPTNPSIVLAGIAPGGSTGGTLYRSTDGGATWAPVSQLANESVFDIEFDPAGVAYIATMDSVWKSVNGGANWTQTNLNIGLNDQVFDVAINPSNPQVIWAAVADAIGNQAMNVLRSPDGGATWANRTPPMGSAMSGRAIAIDPANPAHVAVAFGGSFGGGRVWTTPDDGATWFDRSAGLPTTPAVDIVYSAGRLLVTGGQLFGGQNFGLFSSVNDGANWTPLSASWPSLVGTDIEVAPTDPQHIFVTTPSGLFESTNGGAGWTFGAGGTSALSLNAVRYAAGSPSKIFIGANSAGIWTSTNNGASFTATSTGIGALDVFSVAANPLNNREIAIAFQGANNGGVYTSTDAGATWQLASGIPGTRYNTVAFAPTGLLYAISDGPTSIGNEALYRRNADGTWTYLGPNQGPVFESELFAVRFSKTNPMIIVQGGSDFGAAGFESTLWLSTDGGATWNKNYEGPETSHPISGIEFVDDGSDQVMVASQQDFTGGRMGGIVRSTNGGVSWTRIAAGSGGLPVNFNGYDITNSPASPQTFYTVSNDTTSGGVYRSVDGGQTWAGTGYTAATIQIERDTTDPRVLYIAQSNTTRVLRSADSAATFQPWNTGLTSASGFVRSLSFAPGLNAKLLLATSTGTFATDTGSCFPNCDASTVAPTLNVLDFNCFLNSFTAGLPYANCDGSTVAPVLNVLDFNCFLNAFSVGCP
jgi:photosystem II stability/assembly factor-like uncharacterized protein